MLLCLIGTKHEHTNEDSSNVLDLDEDVLERVSSSHYKLLIVYICVAMDHNYDLGNNHCFSHDTHGLPKHFHKECASFSMIY